MAQQSTLISLYVLVLDTFVMHTLYVSMSTLRMCVSLGNQAMNCV